MRPLRSQRGVTLTELMIATAILSVAILGFVSSFRYISQSLHISRGYTLANNLAQEKIETLKNLTYYDLTLTQSYGQDNNFTPPLLYDNVNYSSETIKIGGITYGRYTFVAMANVDPTSSFVSTTSINFPDTGLKQITVNVVWNQGGYWKHKTLTNLIENPNVNPLDAFVSGQVCWSSGTVASCANPANSTSGPLAGAWVRTEQNQDWGAYTDNNGNYNFKVYHGTYTIKVSTPGYYDERTSSFYATEGTTNNPTPNPLYLTQRATATIAGYVWYPWALEISNVMVSSAEYNDPTECGTPAKGCGPATNAVQYVELFNPTTASWNLGDPIKCNPPPLGTGGPGCTGGNPLVTLNYEQFSGGLYCNIELTFLSTYVPPSSYFLIASTPSFSLTMPSGITSYFYADAIYANDSVNGCKAVVSPTANPQGGANPTAPPCATVAGVGAGWCPGQPAASQSLIMMQTAHTACIFLEDIHGLWLDAVGWENTAILPGTSYCSQSNQVPFINQGFVAGEQIVRVSTPLAHTNYGGDLESYARSYNSFFNDHDFMYPSPAPVAGVYPNGSPSASALGIQHPPFSFSTAPTPGIGILTSGYAPVPILAESPLFQASISVNDPFAASTTSYAVYVDSPTGGVPVINGGKGPMTGTNGLQMSIFKLTGVTTTTFNTPWTLDIVSTEAGNGFTYWKELTGVPSAGDQGNGNFFQNEFYPVPNAFTTPSWTMPYPTNFYGATNYYAIHLDSAPPYGFVAGYVTDIFLNPLVEQLSISSSPMSNPTTNSNATKGYYFFPALEGMPLITANSNAVAPYIQQQQIVSVTNGQITRQDFSLIQGGGISGYVTYGTSGYGTTPLPNVVVNALIGGNQYGTGTSDTTGYFYIKNVTTGTYTVEPILDPSASSQATCAVGTVSGASCTGVVVSTYTVFVGTFSVVGAMANLTGNITYNGNPLTTGGFLLLTKDATVGATPPSIAFSSSPALSNPYYVESSQADGTYTIKARIGSTYYLNIYIPAIAGNGNVTTTYKQYTGVNVSATGTTQNVTVP